MKSAMQEMIEFAESLKRMYGDRKSREAYDCCETIILKARELLEVEKDDKDSFAVSFTAWAMYDPQAIGFREAGITASLLLEKYKSRSFINNNTNLQ